MSENLIELNHVRKEFVTAKHYPGFKGQVRGLFSKETVHKTPVDDVSLAIREGEMVGYIGSNGAGKSTTIKMMSGILTPTSGTCVVNGLEPYRERKKNARNIGVVFGQRTQLWWDLPLGETYTVLKEIYEVGDRDFAERMAFFNEVLNLQEFMHSTVRTLSLGQRMRADLAAALLHNPRVLYLDEPTIGLDVVVKDRIRKAVREINQKYSTTVILTTHDLNDIEELCQRIIIIDAGKKIYDATLDQLMRDYGDGCSVAFEWKQSLDARQEDMLGQLAGSFVLHRQENGVQVCFSRKACTVAEVIAKVMGIAQVKDVRIKETELTDIVKRIYQGSGGGAV
ncbi:MAG: ATP-binding cassette domain-containing protein [Lachnospiraceae bacterium]|nr:ATP-binding cassette domain-containing protein [Lachnospiraceae bacterium]